MKLLEEQIQQTRSALNLIRDQASALHTDAKLSCIQGCGQCCNAPHKNIKVSAKELLPMAWDIYQRGDLDLVLEQLKTSHEQSLCFAFKVTGTHKITEETTYAKGYCQEYANRPILCTVFGSSFQKKKDGNYEFVGCKWQKTQFAEELNSFAKSKDYEAANLQAQFESQVSISQLNEVEPINNAITKALEYVAWQEMLSMNMQSEHGSNQANQ